MKTITKNLDSKQILKKIKHKKPIKGKQAKIVFAVVFVILALHAAVLIYPFVWTFLASLKGSYEYLVSDPFDLPKNWIFKNYIDVFSVLKVRDATYFDMLINSIWYTLAQVIGATIMSSLVAYAMAKYDFKLRNFFYAVIIGIMVIPLFGSGAAAYKLAQDIGIMDTPLIIIRSFGGYGGFQFLVLYGFFKSVSWNYAEAAFIDGASHIKVFFRIMMPIAKGPILSLAVLSSITFWNDYMTPLQYLYSYPTLATGLYVYENIMGRAVNYPMYFTGILICFIPVLLIFIFFQNIIMNSVSMGGLKG